MQTAYREVREAGNMPVQSLMMEPGHSVLLWTPETLDLSRKQVGLQRIEARNFAVFYDQQILERDQSETIFQDASGQPRQLVRHTKTAMACAVEVLIQFGARGVVVLGSMLDRPQGAMVQFEAKLVNAGWFDREKAPLLDDLVAVINGLTAAGAWSDAKEQKAADDLLMAISTAINHRATYADDLMGEAQRAREGKQGRANLTREEQTYLAEIGFNIPTDVAALDIKKAAAQVPMAGVSPAVIELMQVNNRALVSVFSDALNNQAAAFTRALERIGGQSGTGTGQQSTGNDGETADIDRGHSPGAGPGNGSGGANRGGADSGGSEDLGSDKGAGPNAIIADGSGVRGAVVSGDLDGPGEIDAIITGAGERITGAAKIGHKSAGGGKPANKSRSSA
jgi:hypothetical protein